MNRSVTLAWWVGLTVVLIANIAWFTCLMTERFIEIIVIGLFVAPAIAAFVSSYLAPKHKIVIGMSMALPATLFAVAINSIYENLGHSVDFSGRKGMALLAVFVLLCGSIACAIGSAIGYFMTRKKLTKGP